MVALAVTAYWFHVAGEVRKGLDALAAQIRAEGWRVERDAVTLGGFPWRVVAHLSTLHLSHPEGWDWRGENIDIIIRLHDPRRPMVESSGFHTLAGGAWSGMASTEKARLELGLNADGEPASLRFEASKLVLEHAQGDPLVAASLSFGLDLFDPPDASHETPSAAFTLGLTGIELPGGTDLPLDPRIRAAQVEGRIMGSLRGSPPLAALAAWSAEGGTVELDRLVLDWPPLTLEADGTLALDPALQPLIATSARIRGGAELVARLTKEKMLDSGTAAAAAMALRLMARPDALGRATLTMPLTLQDGILSAGQIRLFRVPPLPLPAPSSGANPP